jgi:hypothetical protein
MTIMSPIIGTDILRLPVCQDRPAEIFVCCCEQGGELEQTAREYEIAGKGQAFQEKIQRKIRMLAQFCSTGRRRKDNENTQNTQKVISQ